MRGDRTGRHVLTPAQGLERGRDGGEVKVMTVTRALCGNGTRAIFSHGTLIRKRYQSHLLARDVDAVGNDRHGTGKATAFIYDSKQLCTTVLFMLQHVFDLGLRPTNHGSTQYDCSSRARHVTGMTYSRVGMRHQCLSFVQMDTERG